MPLFRAQIIQNNGSFGDCTTVHCNIFSVLAVRKCMNNFWNTFFSHTTFAGYQHRNIRWSNLNCFLQGTIQFSIVAYYFKPLFYSLYVFHITLYISPKEELLYFILYELV